MSDRAGIIAEHRECGKPKYDGCYSHWPTPHCRADGMALPCDVMQIAATIAKLREALREWLLDDFGCADLTPIEVTLVDATEAVFPEFIGRSRSHER